MKVLMDYAQAHLHVVVRHYVYRNVYERNIIIIKVYSDYFHS